MVAKTEETMIFEYVNVWYDKPEFQGKKKPHKRIPLSEVKTFQHSVDVENFNCFASIQQFASKTIPTEDKRNTELHISPLFFDLDYEEDPSVAQREMVKIVDFFTKELDLQPFDFNVYFSGSKGFHLVIDPRALGIEPGTNLQKVFKWIASYLIHRLGSTDEEGNNQLLKSIDIFSVYTLPRVLRLKNSVHGSTKLHKIELNVEELTSLTLNEIRDLAKNIRREDTLKYTGVDRQEIKRRQKAAQFYEDRRREYEEAAITSSNRYDKEVYGFQKDRHPVCVEDILKNGWKKSGDRNNATIQLACYLKDAGFTKDEALDLLVPWVKKFTSAKNDYEKEQRASNTRHVIYSIYAMDAEYKFGCAFIRSLHGPKNGTADRNYERVPCAGSLCHCLKKNGKQDDPPIPLHLASTGNAAFTGKRVETKVLIAGRQHTPYIVPKKIEYSCWGHKQCKKLTCPLFQIPSHTCYKDLSVADRELIEFCGVGDDNIKGIIKKMSGIPACTKYDILTTENINVDELTVIPMAETVLSNNDVSPGKYVLRKVYSVGGLPINENKYYKIIGFVYPHPKNQEGTIAIESAEPLQDIVDQFVLTDDVKKKLKKDFRPKSFETPGDIQKKLDVLFQDMTYNVTHIVKRDELLLAILLVYHSVLRINVPWSNNPIRGWLECVVMGDTETGKSEMIRNMQQYIGLGQEINAESTTRTGLMYMLTQNGSRGDWSIVWGAWPLAHRELIWIDEFTGITKEDYGEMTQARSDGKLIVKRAATAEMACCVRMLASGNPKSKDGNNRLGNYGSGCQALEEALNNEDIRRFDFGIFLKKSDIDPSEFTKVLGFYPKTFTPELLRNNILFSWSRTPDQVEFSPVTLQLILDTAAELSKIYGNAASVPLVSTADQRNKVVRLSTALAALTNSVDNTGEVIVVLPAHVEYIKIYLKAVYNAPGCGLNQYARMSLKESELTDKAFDKITSKLMTCDYLKEEEARLNVTNMFFVNSYLRQGTMESLLNISKEQANAITSTLHNAGLIKSTGLGLAKTAIFNNYINKCFIKGVFDNLNSDDDDEEEN
jgi:hypothetical protein